MNLVNDFELNRDCLQQFFLETCKAYNFAPFHNMTHAFNVSHMCFWVLTQNSFISKAVSPLEKLSMILACIGHDLDHPGIGNTYFVKAEHMISLTVNGQSVLEHLHAYTLFSILDKTRLLSNMKASDFQ